MFSGHFFVKMFCGLCWHKWIKQQEFPERGKKSNSKILRRSVNVLVLFSWQWCRIWGSKAFCRPLKMFCFDKNHFCKILLHIRHPSQKISELQCLCFLSPTATYLHYFFYQKHYQRLHSIYLHLQMISFHPILKIPILMLHLMYK